jgi:eukaryotic-like serine/threonine-protein kinase
MQSDRFESLSEQIEQIFHDARELSPADRSKLLDDRCNGNDGLRKEVERLLASSDDLEDQLAWNQPAIVTEAQWTARDEMAAEIERYRLLELIGSGGMGVVYKASRADDAFSKLVAIKIVHTAAANSELLRRFVQERQILAGLEHPNIARLLDGGTTSQGLPFLVMEYVDGVPIHQYLRENTPGLDRILHLFRKICSAVSYAHRNLIVHRDLKPTNILVTADGEPKLLDFGIAKLMDGSGATKTGPSSMTPEYASPEQVRGASITTASDIYSLGVLLYEMLTSARLYGESLPALDLARAIADQKPVSMSEKIGRPFDADLENIVQKALRKEPDRRYSSADEFAEDIRRYQEGYPVIAQPNSRAYRWKRFIGRNKAAVTVGVLVFAAFVAAGIAIWQQAQIANRRFNDVRRLANAYLFEFYDSIKDLPGATPAKQLALNRAIEFLDNLAKERGKNVDLGRELASAYDKIADLQGGVNIASLGDQAAALSTYRRALAIRKELATLSPSNLDVTRELAYSYAEVGWISTYRGDLKGVEDLKKAVALGEKVMAAAPADPRMREGLAIGYTALGDVLGNPNYQNLGDTKAAIDLYQKGLKLREQLLADEPKSIERRMLLASSSSRLGQLLQAQDDKVGAVAAYRRAAEISDELSADQPGNARFRRESAVSNRNLAWSLVKMNSLDEARKRGDLSMDLFERVARDDPKNSQARVEVAEGYYSQGYVRSAANDNAGALRFFNSAVTLFEAVAAEHPADLPRPGLRTTYQLLADLTLKTGDTAAAVRNAQHELEIDDRLLKLNPGNASAERNQGLAMRQIAKAHELNGMRESSSKTTRVAELNEAKSWYRRSLAVFESQKAKGTLIPMYAADLETTPKAIAKCDSALEALGIKAR